jgi:hypothetical protein
VKLYKEHNYHNYPWSGNSIYWAQLGMLQLKTEIESSLQNVREINKRQDNVQNCDSYVNIPGARGSVVGRGTMLQAEGRGFQAS